MSGEQTVLITVTGNDRPGVTGVLFTVLGAHQVEVVDVRQVVVQGALTLGVLVSATGDPERLAEQVEQAMASIGMRVRVSLGRAARAERREVATHVVVVLGRPLQAKAFGSLARAFGGANINILAIRTIADYPVTGVELDVISDDEQTLRAVVARIGQETGMDIAVQQTGLGRRGKRLIVFDVDSTLITGEVIEMLADHIGQRAEIEQITAAAMAGEIDFAESLRQRVGLLAGLDASVLDVVSADLELTPGARTTIRTLKRLGFSCGVVSGGFTQVVAPLARELGLDFVAANTLEIADGVLTGQVSGPIVDRAGKAAALRTFADRAGVGMDQTVAVGDGANDIDMLSAAGLGIAFNAKPIVASFADTSLNQPFLDPVLFILGITRSEVEAADDADGIDTAHR